MDSAGLWETVALLGFVSCVGSMFKKNWFKEHGYVQHFCAWQQRQKWAFHPLQVLFYFVNLMVGAVAFLVYIYLWITA